MGHLSEHEQMRKIVSPKSEAANPSLQLRLQDAVLYNQRTYIRLNVSAVLSCFMCTNVFDCKLGAILPLAARLSAATLCP